jgi:hypothetical protein
VAKAVRVRVSPSAPKLSNASRLLRFGWHCHF